MGLMHMVTARSAKIGTRTFAVAVLEAMFVMDTGNIDGQMFPRSLIINYIGTRTLAVALLTAMFVKDTVNVSSPH